MSPARTSASLGHATVVAGSVADVPCEAPGLPWSAITVRVCEQLDSRLRKRERAIRANNRLEIGPEHSVPRS